MKSHLLFIFIIYFSSNCFAQSNIGFFGGYGKARLYKFPFSGETYENKGAMSDYFNVGFSYITTIDDKTEIFVDLSYRYYSLEFIMYHISTPSFEKQNEVYSLPQFSMASGYLFLILKRDKFEIFLPFGLSLNYFFNSTYSGINYNTVAIPVTTPNGTIQYVFVEKKYDFQDEEANNITKFQLDVMSGFSSRIKLDEKFYILIHPKINLGVSNFFNKSGIFAPMTGIFNLGINYKIK